jgi:hypothetical protein
MHSSVIIDDAVAGLPHVPHAQPPDTPLYGCVMRGDSCGLETAGYNRQKTRIAMQQANHVAYLLS